MYKLQVRVTVRMSDDFLNKSACHTAHIHHRRQSETLFMCYCVKNFQVKLGDGATFLCHFSFFFFYNSAVASVVPYLLFVLLMKLCCTMLHWIEIILTLTAALQAHATVFFPPPSGKITITLE